MNHEEWRPIAGAPFSQVSSLGRVKNVQRTVTYKDGRSYEKAECILQSRPKQGYPSVQIKGRGPVCVHTLVAESFIGAKPPWARTVNHKDGNKHNNKADNLEWASYAENNRHARLTKLNKQHGERCNLTDFGDDVVDAIRLLWPTKRFTQKELGALFGMSENHVHEIVRFKSRTRPTESH